MSQYTEILADFLQLRRGEIAETEKFRHLKHDKDLCEGFREKVDAVFNAFDKYHRVVYDIQGLKDEGTDVLLSERIGDKKEYVSFQVKGEWDLSQKDYLKTLKSQYFDSIKRYGDSLKDYYIVLCYSIATKDKQKQRLTLDKGRKEKVKGIIREFELMPQARVIEPEWAASFLALSQIQIDVVIKSRFGNEDIVFKEAINLVSELSSTEKIILVFMLWLHLYRNKSTTTSEEIVQSEFIQRTFASLPEEIDEDDEGYHYYPLDLDSQVARDLERLEGNFVERGEGNDFSLPLDSVQPLAVLLMDGHIRYDHNDDELLTYMLALLGVVSTESSG